jgi:hypothetical protein
MIKACKLLTLNGGLREGVRKSEALFILNSALGYILFQDGQTLPSNVHEPYHAIELKAQASVFPSDCIGAQEGDPADQKSG